MSLSSKQRFILYTFVDYPVEKKYDSGEKKTKKMFTIKTARFENCTTCNILLYVYYYYSTHTHTHTYTVCVLDVGDMTIRNRFIILSAVHDIVIIIYEYLYLLKFIRLQLLLIPPMYVLDHNNIIILEVFFFLISFVFVDVIYDLPKLGTVFWKTLNQHCSHSFSIPV